MTRINIRDYLHFPEETDCTGEVGLNQEERDEMLEAFTLFDRDGDGLIDTRGLGRVIRCLGQALTVCEETDIVAQFAQEECHEIDYVAFVRLLKGTYKRVDDDDRLRESFRRFDKEENGFLDVENLKSMLTTVGEPLSSHQVEEWLQDGEKFLRNGKIDYEKFVTFMLSK